MQCHEFGHHGQSAELMAKFIKCQASLRANSLSGQLQEDFEQAARGLGY